MTTAPTSQTILFMGCSSSMRDGPDPSDDAAMASNCGADYKLAEATI
jgi:hypothetical protein